MCCIYIYIYIYIIPRNENRFDYEHNSFHIRPRSQEIITSSGENIQLKYCGNGNTLEIREKREERRGEHTTTLAHFLIRFFFCLFVFCLCSS